MIAAAAVLEPREQAAVRKLLRRVLAEPATPLVRAALFGSKARGEADADSDVDVLLVCAVPFEARPLAGETAGRLAEEVTAATGVRLQPWTVCVEDLREGRRTPMLVDALEDSIPLWPADAPPWRPPFTPADAVFCAERLLEWVEAGDAVMQRALRDDRWAEAAARARDDIARLATAALLLDGDTRHRRLGTLARFERRFVDAGAVSPRVRPALAWAARAYPPDGGRGQDHPPASPAAARSARLGCALAAVMRDELTIPLLERIAALLEATDY